MNAKEFCTCKNTECNLNPANHDEGCDLCMQVNIAGNTVPRCLFHKVMGEELSSVKTWSFEEFAEEVVRHK